MEDNLNLFNQDDLIDEKEAKFYYKNKSRKIVASLSKKDNEEAKLILIRILKENKDRIPEEYINNWDNVMLYNPGKKVEKSRALILDLKNGAYDIRNKLNDLTGKQWTIFTCSWFIFNALHSDLKEEKEIAPNSSDHPATYSPTMVSNFIEYFTKKGQTVLDPFSGIGSTLVACKRTGRIGYGVELNSKYYEIIKKRVPEFHNNIFNYDSKKLDEIDMPIIDFSISSPPYWDVLNRSTDGFRNNRESKGYDYTYSTSKDDVGNIDNYEDFLGSLKEIYFKVYDKMRNGAYIVIIVKNIKKKGKLYPLAWDLARILSERFVLKDEKIWIQDKVGLSPFGYPNSWASNILHHYCLILRKE